VQRLPIEPVSRASADQRMGRCGRVGPGVCIRLYEEADYAARDRYTPPEIQRSNLAAVILQALGLRFGRIEDFPFPRPAAPREYSRRLSHAVRDRRDRRTSANSPTSADRSAASRSIRASGA